MKFLAMLKDSLREAIDAKVFYVMVGLSTLLILLALTATFTPKPGGEAVMRAAAIPLSVDLANFESGSQDDDPGRLIERLRKSAGDLYQVTRVEPAEGAPDLPSSTFVLKITTLPVKGLLGKGSSESDPVEHIRQKFGRLGDWTIADVIDVKQVNRKGGGGWAQLFSGKPNEFEVTVRPTPTALRLWPHDFSLFFGALPVLGTGDKDKGAPLGFQVFFIEQLLINSIGAWITILISIVITAFFIPNMLRKGTVDLLIVKPISRSVLLLYKYVGGLIFIALNTAVAVAGVWLAFGLRSGIWSTGFLASIPVITFFFAILYSASTLFAVLSRSPIVAILLTCAVWFLLFIVGTVHGVFEVFREMDRVNMPRNRAALYSGVVTLPANLDGGGPLLAATTLSPRITDQLSEVRFYDWTFARIVAGLHYVLPRTSDLSTLNSQLSFREMVFPIALNPAGKRVESISWGESLTVSGAFIVVMLGLSCWRFATKDY
jgi:ABC-type transport system involved in multi-copper enzyme maturation permease subunit